MSDEHPSYRRRNIALAAIAGVVLVAAIVRLQQTSHLEPATGPAPSVAAAPVRPIADAGRDIGVDVSYAGSVDALPTAAKVYVFIRPVGERMPLGVQAYGARDLPVSVEFAPAPAAAEQSVEVVARLSMTGSVSLLPGDLESVSGALHFGSAPRVRLTLGAAASTSDSGSAPSSGPTGDALEIKVHVALGPGIDLPSSTTVFVIVRAASGGPMPLAVKRLTVGDLPADLSLSDADAMVPGRTLRAAGRVELVARAVVSGGVKPAPGDYEGSSGALQVEQISAPVALSIDRAL